MIRYETSAGTYYTATNEATGAQHADGANDDPQHDDAQIQGHAYATEDGAIAAERAEIEEAIGAAEPEEIRDALETILAGAYDPEVSALHQAIASYRKANGGDLRAADANKALADTLAVAVDGTQNSHQASTGGDQK